MESQKVKLDNCEAKDQEINLLKKKVFELESQLAESQKLIQKHLLEANEVDLLKMKSADTLTKAKSVIFENTKMIKNQELQIEALNQQVESLRDVVKITKELLEIRNLEVDQLESKIHCMEEKYKAEKERQDLMHQRLEQMIRHNGELKREYEAQLCLFQALRERYSERELAKGVVDNLKTDVQNEKNLRNGELNRDEESITTNNQQDNQNDAVKQEEKIIEPSNQVNDVNVESQAIKADDTVLINEKEGSQQKPNDEKEAIISTDNPVLLNSENI